MFSYLAIIAFVVTLKSVESGIGVDVYTSLTTTQLNCLKNNNTTFLITRIYQSNGQVDQKGISNIAAAKLAGFTDIDVFLYPCVSSSSCPKPREQVLAVYQALLASNLSSIIGHLWLDIEAPSQWSKDQVVNQETISDLLDASDEFFQSGIFTTTKAWKAIVGDIWSGYSYQHPLWWSHLNGRADLSTDWKPFNQWDKPFMHQYASAHECNINNLFKNYKD